MNTPELARRRRSIDEVFGESSDEEELGPPTVIRLDELDMTPETDDDNESPSHSSHKRARHEQEVIASEDEDDAGSAGVRSPTPLLGGQFSPGSHVAEMVTDEAERSSRPSSSFPEHEPALSAEATPNLEPASSSSSSNPAPKPEASSSNPAGEPAKFDEWKQVMESNWIDMALHESKDPLSVMIAAMAAKLKADRAEIKTRLNDKYEDLVAEQQRYLETLTREITSTGSPDMCNQLSKAVRAHDIRISEIQEQRAHEEKQYQQTAAGFPDFDKLDTLLTCPVEQAKTSDPVMLTCRHLIGRTSALELQRRAKESGGPFQCPVCRRTNNVRIPIRPKATTASILLGALIPAGI